MNTPKSDRPPPVPLDQYAGKWIVWDRQRTRIVSSGRTLEEVQAAAAAAGEQDPVYEKVPKAARWLGAIG